MNIADPIQRAVQRVDSWINLITGVGLNTRKNALAMRAAEGDYLDEATLDTLYDLDGIAARIVRAVPQHSLREGFTVTTGTPEADTATHGQLDELGAVEKLRLAWTWGRLHGGGALFVGADDGRDPKEPLDEANIRRVLFLVDLDRRDLTPQTYVRDRRSGRYGQPETYQMTRNGGTVSDVSIVHASRIIRFDGAEVSKRRRIQLQGWGDSILQRVYSDLQQTRGVHAAVATLVHESSQGIYKVKNLAGMMSADGKDDLKWRLEMMDMARSVARAVIVDADGEDFTRAEVGALAGLVEVMDRFVNMLAASSEMPVCILMGQAPAGLNATGQADTRAWYDAVKAERKAILQPRAERLVKLLLLSKEGPTGGVEPAGWRTVWPPLWQMTPGEEADLRNKVADTDGKYVTMQALTPEEVAINRFRKDGWSAETSIDLEARTALVDADKATGNTPAGGGGANAPGSDHADAAAKIIAQVASREIPRDAGVQLLVSSLGMAADEAERVMGEAGRAFFTAPDPAAMADHETLKTEHAALKASNASTRAMLARVLERNRNGELVVGSPIAKAPTATEPGDVVSEGDVIATPAAAQQEPKTDAADGPHVAIVLPVPDAQRAALALAGGTAPDELHVTLAYLGRLADLPPGALDQLATILRTWASWASAIPASLGGVGRFPTGPNGDPVYRPVDSEALTTMRPGLLKALRAGGFEVAPGHGYTPHMTIAYVSPADATPAPLAPVSVMFGSVALWAGDTRVDVALGGAE